MTIWFDMDGTIVDLYHYPKWRQQLMAENAAPYRYANGNLNLSRLARYINIARSQGHKVGIVSWGAKNSSKKFFKETVKAKVAWLDEHLPSVEWDYIDILPYGTPKEQGRAGVLFDDYDTMRNDWGIGAFEPNSIYSVLRLITR